MTHYRIEQSAWGDTELFRYRSDNDQYPESIATRHARNDRDEQWELMVHGAGLDDTALLDRDTLTHIAEQVHTLAEDLADNPNQVHSHGVRLLARRLDQLAGTEVQR